jgi:hypothetical protein
MEWNDFSIINLEAAVSPLIYERGIDYLCQGHLMKACKIDDLLAGVLTGTGGDYKVRLWFNQSELQGECSCPYHGFCKHMVALAAAWVEDKTRFFDLQPQLTLILEKPANLTNILLSLIRKDPLNFLELFPDQSAPLDFINARGVLNLIRNAFAAPRVTTADAEAVWEKVKHLERLVVDKFQAGDPQAPELLIELMSGLEKTAESCYNQSLNKFFADFIGSLHPVAGQNPAMIRPLLEKLLAIYLNPNLWELTGELKPVLLNLYENDPDFFRLQVNKRLNNEPSLLTLISLYTLLAEDSPDDPRLQEALRRITERLYALPDGRLWLIDRLMESDPGQAYNMAKTGLQLFAQAKAGFRERLIVIHQKQAEFKQAAAFSFIQFQEEPNFEEYLRLKEILSIHPADWEHYRRRIKKLLMEQGLEILTLRIMVEDQDLQGMTHNLERILADDTLLMATVKLFTSKIETGFTQFYPPLIKALLERRVPSDWKAALQLLVTFKRYCCYDAAKKDEWLQLRDELLRTYPDDTGFTKKFGSILRS